MFLFLTDRRVGDIKRREGIYNRILQQANIFITDYWGDKIKQETKKSNWGILQSWYWNVLFKKETDIKKSTPKPAAFLLQILLPNLSCNFVLTPDSTIITSTIWCSARAIHFRKTKSWYERWNADWILYKKSSLQNYSTFICRSTVTLYPSTQERSRQHNSLQKGI